jgi:alpha-amylase
MRLSGIRIQIAVAAAGLALAAPARAGVMLQGLYVDVPTPKAHRNDPRYSPTYWWDRLAQESHALAQAGFTAVWLPPATKGANGGYSVGYDPYDDYDIGSKWQNSGSNGATRYGTRVQLQRLAAMLKANGMEVYLDIVENHRNGDPGNKVFRYVDAYGDWPGGRFQKNPGDFHPNVPQDPNVPADWYSNDASFENGQPFGPDLAPVNSSTPNRYLWDGLNAAADWQTKALDADGFRLDYVKGISTDWLNSFLTTGAMSGKFAVGEYFDGDVGKVQRWIGATNGRASAFDFPLRYMLKEMCMAGGYFDMSRLDHAGLVGVDPFHAVTFVENHDTDDNDAITQNKMLAYAYVLTSEGYPCVFYRDYSTAPGAYGLKPRLDPLVWIHEKIAGGRTQQRYKSDDIFAYERMGREIGGKNLLVGLTDNGASPQTITVDTGFGPNAALHDYTGNGPDITTDGDGKATITIPANANDNGYVCYAEVGIIGGFSPAARETTQEYAGAPDLDIRPADATPVRVAAVYARANSPVRLELWYHTDASWTDETRVDVTLQDPNGVEVAKSSFDKAGPQGGGFVYTPVVTGYHYFYIQSFNTSATDPRPNYWLKAHYTAPPFFSPEPPNALRVAGGLAAATPVQAMDGPVDLLAAVRLLRAYNGLD